MFNNKRIAKLETEVAVLKSNLEYMQHDVEKNLDRFNKSMGRVSHHLNGTCPECRSENYMQLSSATAPHCFDCGYPISQTGSRMVDLGMQNNA